MNSIETVEVDDRDLQMYVSEPESDDYPGVLLVHAWWGFNECFRDLCDRLAREDFLVVAPDLYDGDIASTIEEAEGCRQLSIKRKRKRTLEPRSISFAILRT